MALPPGWIINDEIQRPDPALVAEFEGVGTGPVGDALGRFAALDITIKPISREMRILGPAFTVHTRPCDNLAVYAALELAHPGDVLVVSNGGSMGNSVFGELTTQIALARGLEGLVTDSVVRDAADIIDLGFPVFARGLTPNSGFKDGPGQLNVPLTCGGQVIHPGDLVIGDIDGVVVVPQAQIEGVLARVRAIEEKEVAWRTEIQASNDLPAAARAMLREHGLLND